MRYAILEHRRIGCVHWDLLLAGPWEGLRTWRLARPPESPAWRPAEPLAIHRLVYLVYQGPVYPSRGSVRRWDEGAYRLQRDDPSELRLLLWGRRLCGLLEMERIGDSREWRYRFERRWRA